MAQVSIRKIVKSYDTMQVVHGIDLEIADREFVVLVGPSGCGKSTTLRMIAGLEEISSGRDPYRRAAGQRRAAARPGHRHGVPELRAVPAHDVYDNMAFGLKLRHTSPRRDPAAGWEDAARMLDITPLLARKPKALSGGQRQRVAMGRAIVRNPQVFLFDEPLSNLDAKLRVQMRTEIKKVHQIVPTTTVYVTHDQVEAMTLADRVVVMNGGHIEQVGPPQELYHHPVSRFVATFIGSPGMNVFPARVDGSAEALHLVLADGATLPIPQARTARYAQYRGQPMLLGLRPEHLTDMQPAGRPGTAALTVTPDVVEPMGMETMVHFAIDGHALCARCAPLTAAAPGVPLVLTADMTQMHLMEPASGHVV